jgi:antirestriction protein ArdC
MSKKNAYQVATEKILELLDDGEVPWTKPWTSRLMGYQKNLNSGRAYTGFNALSLAMSDKPSPYWLTFKQANELGLKIRKGEKATAVIGWFKFAKKSQDETDEEEKRSRLCAKVYRVFNVSQCDGLSDKLKELAFPPVKTFETPQIEKAEKLVKDTKALITYGHERACYIPSMDKIEMPAIDRFKSSEEYYSTAFHELGHWTGHTKRLNRKEVNKAISFQSKDYSQEELVAEMTSIFVCSSLDITSDTSVRNSAAYIQGWKKFIKDNEKAFVIACQRAQKAADFILKA